MARDTGQSQPWMRPLWVRLLIVAVCLAWVALELSNSSLGWGLLAMAATAYAVWAYLIDWKDGSSPE